MKGIALAALVVVTSAIQSSPGGQRPDCSELIRKMQDRVRAERGSDFAQLSRYREANRTLERSARQVIFMGDSITDFWSSPDRGGFFPGKPFTNRGIGGQTTAHMLLRFRQDVIALAPDLAVIHAGANDIALNLTDEETDGNLLSMCELARANRIRVVLASVLPVNDYHPRIDGASMTRLRPPARILAMNARVAAHAREHGHVFLDYHGAMVDDAGMLRKDLSDDGVHPNARGYAVMAPLVEAAAAQALASPAR